MNTWLRNRATPTNTPRPAWILPFPPSRPGRTSFPATRSLIDDPELTSVCPKTGLPDFGVLTIRYMPRERCLELKSLKEYLFSYRNLGIFQENIVNQVLEDVVKACDPVWAVVRGEFRPRGGIGTTVEARWPRPVSLSDSEMSGSSQADYDIRVNFRCQLRDQPYCPLRSSLFAPASAPPWGHWCCSSA